MNGSCESPEPRLCGCCEGVGPETPQPIANRPGLSAIAYRVGTHPTFKASMLAALSDPSHAALAGLRTRDDADFSIALLDAWASAADILTFYQERLANEAYLRTAVERRSVIELARLVGYKPSPGVAASAFLAFTLSSAPGAPASVLIPAGTRVQSVPGPGQSPQVFETAADLAALAGANAIPAQTTVPWGFNPGDTSMRIAGTANQLNVGDLLLFIGSGFDPSDPINSGQWDYHFITSVATDPAAGNTFVTWDSALASDFPTNDTAIRVYVFRKKAALFGVQAPDPRTLPASATSNVTGAPANASSDWTYTYFGGLQVSLDASYPGIAIPATGAGQWAVFLSPDWVYAPFHITAAEDASTPAYTLTTKTTRLTLQDEPWLDMDGTVIATTDQLLTSLVSTTRSITAYVQSDPLQPADPPYLAWPAYDGTYARQSGVLRPMEGPTLEIVGGQQIAAGQPVGVSGKRLRLQVRTGAQAIFVPQGAAGALPVTDGETFIVDAFPPAPNSPQVAGGEIWQTTTTSGVAGALHVAPGNLTLVPAAKGDPVAGEAVVVNAVSANGPITTLSFVRPLGGLYDRATADGVTASVNANAVAASNGETTHEILGSGDAANPALAFALKQKPLTYTSAPNGTGAQSTLQVWVNNLIWHEVETFLPSGPTDRVFVTRTDDSGAVTVQFGDGVQGARTPTGQMNIRATYRKGLGAAGNVAAGQLSQALDRPQGMTGAINPSAATGGADPDSADAARTSAPLHVLTLDRVVSLDDYQNFARAFAGIGKALATWTWWGRTRGVFLTIAGAGGATFEPGDPTVVNLAKALRNAGNPHVPLLVASYVPVLFEMGANVRVDSNNYDPAQVLASVWQTLAQAFAFDRRDLGQGVAQSNVVAVIQGVPGVIAVEMTAFGFSGQAPPASGVLPAVLRAASPIAGGTGTPQAAQLLVLDPASQGALTVWS